MMLRDFHNQNVPMARVRGSRLLRWLELRCPQCDTMTYVEGRKQRLARIGSAREYTTCVGCGERLTLGKLVTYPNGHRKLKDRLQFWRREPMKTVTVEMNNG